jgi:hypothetical protein
MASQRGLEVHVLDRHTTGPKPLLVRDLGGHYHTESVKDLAATADVVVECTGVGQFVFDILQATPGTITCLTGVSSGRRPIPTEMGALNKTMVLENDVVFGSVNGNRRHYEKAADALARADTTWLKRIVNRSVSLDAWADALARQSDDVKPVIQLTEVRLMALPFEDYALIGDCQTAALVGKDGSVDWLCFPRFDSPACFAALLGTPENGRWRMSPAGDVRASRRRYLGDTLVLETEWETADGVVAVIDFMPIRGEAPDVVRIVEGRGGVVRVRSELVIRFEYGSVVPWVQRNDGGVTAVAGPNALRLRTAAESHGENLKTVSEFTVREGERVPFVLTWHRSFDPDPTSVDAEGSLKDTLAWWREWSERCTYEGARRDLVIRSLVTLKALQYLPSGEIAAAATTSLPEFIGGVRNWDYRYCWLRDATLTLLALVNAGYTDEACAWREWLLRAVAGDPAKLQIMYGLGGERRLEEYEVPWLAGYENSKPIRVGNAASTQFQLDVYGEVANALHQARVAGLKAARGMGLGKGADPIRRRRMGRTGRRDLGGQGPEAALHALEGHGLGRPRPGD